MGSRLIAAAASVAAAILLAGCSGASTLSTTAMLQTTAPQKSEPTKTAHAPTTTTTPQPEQLPRVVTTTSTETVPYQTKTEPRRVPKPRPRRVRTAPPSTAGPLRFDRVHVFAASSGRFAGQANVTNRGTRYLNRLVIAWRVLDAHGRTLARGTARWPSLAPAETTTLHFRGAARNAREWTRVRFVLLQG
jgi:hypothetical protein